MKLTHEEQEIVQQALLLLQQQSGRLGSRPNNELYRKINQIIHLFD